MRNNVRAEPTSRQDTLFQVGRALFPELRHHRRTLRRRMRVISAGLGLILSVGMASFLWMVNDRPSWTVPVCARSLE